MAESETLNAFKRAGSRVVYHMLRAGVESLKAVEALVDEPLGEVAQSLLTGVVVEGAHERSIYQSGADN